jgi:hypothetical protein
VRPERLGKFKIYLLTATLPRAPTTTTNNNNSNNISIMQLCSELISQVPVTESAQIRSRTTKQIQGQAEADSAKVIDMQTYSLKNIQQFTKCKST